MTMQTPSDPWHSDESQCMDVPITPEQIESVVTYQEAQDTMPSATLSSNNEWSGLPLPEDQTIDDIYAPADSKIPTKSVSTLPWKFGEGTKPEDIAEVLEKEYLQSMKESIAAIPDIILEFKQGQGVDQLSEKYGFEKEVVESIIRLSFRIRVLKSS